MTKYENPTPYQMEKRAIAREGMRRLRADGHGIRQYRALVDLREETCAICGASETVTSALGDVRRLAIDHDHDTGMVRDLLCNRCNAGIAYLGDTLERVEAAADYLRKHRDSPSGIRWRA